MHTLIIDDSPVMRKVVERSLKEAGLTLTQLHQAANGEEALTLLRTNPPLDLILSDINMPIMDGLQFLEQRRLENLVPNVPVIMITSESTQSLVLRALAAGARGYICKPFTPTQIRTRILPLLTRK